MTVTSIPGAEELVGKGVYSGVPKDVPQPLRDRRAVVVGHPRACAAAARTLASAGWSVTVLRAGSELVCATGIQYLEAVVLRRATGRVDACNASALFIL